MITLTLPCRWSQQRQAFGKPLHAQAVVRSKLAQMIARVESAQNWLENVTHQMNNVRPMFWMLPNHSFRMASETPEIDVIRRAVRKGRRSDCSSKRRLAVAGQCPIFFWSQICHKHRARYRRRRSTNIWWTIYHTDRHGQVGRERASALHSIHFSLYVLRRDLLIQYHRTSPYDAILGGAEDVMGDLGVRQVLRKMPKNARL